MKKLKASILSIVSIALIYIFLFPVMSTQAATTGKNNSTITYTLTDDGTLTLKGSGYISPIPKYLAPKIKHVIVEKGILGTTSYAFENCPNLKTVSLPEGVDDIGDYAFSNCTELESINLPDSIEYIGSYAFYKCTSLKYVTIPKSLPYLESYTFAYCTSLTLIHFPKDMVTDIDEEYQPYAPFYMSGLKTITFEKGITDIPQSTFAYCTKLENIAIPDTVTRIWPHAFDHCTSLKSVTLSKKLKYIGKDSFSDCWSLKYITIPASLVGTDNGYIDYGTSTYGGPFSNSGIEHATI